MPTWKHLQLVDARDVEGEAPPLESSAGEREGTASRPRDRGASIRVEEAFRQYAPLVAAIGFRILGSRDETQDLVQDVFLKAHDWIGRIKDPGALRSWLITVTVREARRRLRLRRMRSFLALGDTFDYETVAGSNASPAERVLTAEVYRLLDRASIDARVAWTLRYVEGLTLPEIARHCGCSLATVKRRVAHVHEFILKGLDDA